MPHVKYFVLSLTYSVNVVCYLSRVMQITGFYRMMLVLASQTYGEQRVSLSKMMSLFLSSSFLRSYISLLYMFGQLNFFDY